MKKLFLNCSLFFLLTNLVGCSMTGAKTASMSVIYGITAVLSLLVLLGYCLLDTKKDVWFLLLFSSVLIVNIGYYTLAISKNLEEALLANRISYLGSVFLPLAMLMIILNVIQCHCKTRLTIILFIIGLLVFVVAASPGYLDIYYKEVSLITVNGVSMLNKIYGPWHNLYYFYLFIYFVSMIGIIIFAALRKKAAPLHHAIILLFAVFINMVVWLVEQKIRIDFEILSFSYIISETFLLGLHIIIAENNNLKEQLLASNPLVNASEVPNTFAPEMTSAVFEKSNNVHDDSSCPASASESDQLSAHHTQFVANMTKLTKTEKIIFDLYVAGKTTKEILQELCITENTLKFHNKNLYSKLEVSSRKQLIEIYRQIKATKTSA